MSDEIKPEEEKKEPTKKSRFKQLAATKSQEKTESKGAKRTLLTGTETTKNGDNDPEENTHADTDTNSNADPNTQPKTVINKENETQQQENLQLYSDPVMELVNVVATGNKKKKLEDERVRATYWLLPEERKMVNKLARETGYPKYDVVGMAIRSMHDRVMQAKPEKKTKKKPDQQ